ncbi:hypothetical protein ACWD0J_15350 [Streptomyces sp. NPDC003011]
MTVALVVVVCFWFLAAVAAVGVVAVDSFDADVDLRGWRSDGVPVAVAPSGLTMLLAWCLRVRGGGRGRRIRATGACHRAPSRTPYTMPPRNSPWGRTG